MYFILYAYFLKKKNGAEIYEKQRQQLIDIYSNTNELFGNIQNGGTYFGHQFFRIYGYAEYSIYLYSKTKYDFEKTYNYSKQKELYINSLRQIIEDEKSIDYETLDKDKIERNKKLNKIVDNIDKKITDIFFLRRAQEFQYSNYQYY